MSLVKSHGHWLLFDDDQVDPISDACVERTFGSTAQYGKNTDRGYILFYEKSSAREVHPWPVVPQSADLASGDSNSTESRKVPPKAAGVSESALPRTMSGPADLEGKSSDGKVDTGLPRGGSEILSSESLYKRVTKLSSWLKTSKTGGNDGTLPGKSSRGSRTSRSIA